MHAYLKQYSSACAYNARQPHEQPDILALYLNVVVDDFDRRRGGCECHQGGDIYSRDSCSSTDKVTGGIYGCLLVQWSGASTADAIQAGNYLVECGIINGHSQVGRDPNPHVHLHQGTSEHLCGYVFSATHSQMH